MFVCQDKKIQYIHIIFRHTQYIAYFIGKEVAGMERIDRLYALLERDDIDEDTKAALRGAIFQLENAT